MIKINRASCPNELTDELKNRLTEKYKLTGKDVWNEDCIKPFLKKTLSDMTNEKCSYCECKINIESNDATIDHIVPKSIDKNKVMDWDNLIISCLRCNRQKNAFEEEILNPCIHNPKEHLYFVLSRYMIKGKNSSDLGIKTVETLDLNDLERIRKKRFLIGEKVKDELLELFEKINSRIVKGWNPLTSDINALMGIMEEALPTSDYSATVATVLLNDDSYNNILNLLKTQGKWNAALENLHKDVEQIKFSITDD